MMKPVPETIHAMAPMEVVTRALQWVLPVLTMLLAMGRALVVARLAAIIDIPVLIERTHVVGSRAPVTEV